MVSKPKMNQSISIPTNKSASPDVKDISANNREKDLERRLALLGDVPLVEEDEEDEEDEEAVEPTQPTEEPVVAVVEKNEPSMEEPTPTSVVVETTPPPAPIVLEEKPEPLAPVVPPVVMKTPVMNPRPIMLKTNEVVEAAVAAPKAAPVSAIGNKNALLARIMAVQEKAKQAQLKKAAAMTEVVPPTVTSYKEQMMEALNDGTNKLPTPPPSFPQTMTKPTTKTEQAPTVADYRDKMMEALNNEGGTTTTKKQFVPPPPPPPPSFDTIEQQQQETKAPAAPPSFDTIGYSMMDESVVPSAPPVEPPTPLAAPPIDLLSSNHLSNITSIVPPPPTEQQPPPSFDTLPPPTQQQQEDEDAVYDFDLEGNALTPAQKLKMMEEQRAILAQIQKSTTQDSASQAAARAVAFDQRSNTAAAAAASDGFVRPSASLSRGGEKGPIVVEVAGSMDGVEHTVTRQSVDIGGGQKVALHGQEKTRTAIKEGTAVLVKCLNCDNWMQVTKTATLMFCPICSVVSPVVQQDNAPCEEEVRQMDEDRRLAERLQKEENEREVGGGSSTRSGSGYPATRRSGSAAATESADTGSWLGGLLPANMWSTAEEPSSAEITVTRPPGSRQPATRGGLIDATIGTRAGESDLHLEQESLLTGGTQENGRSARAGRVAESKPMFSCVVDSISSTANAMSGAMASYTTGEEEVHGVDSSSFLSVTNAQREGDGAASYRAVPDTDSSFRTS